MGAPQAGFEYARDMCLEAEELGFDSVWLPDHVINAHMDRRQPMLENWTVLSALAVLTQRVKFAGHTFNNSLRHPAVLAKMAATFDVITGGRLIYSLGSAWFRPESESYGLPWDDHDDRVARLREALLIARSLWTEDETTFDGRFYRLDTAYLEPKPVACIARIAAYEQLGAEHLIIQPIPPLEGMRFFAESIIPAFRASASA